MVNFTRTKPWTIYPKPGVLDSVLLSVPTMKAEASLKLQIQF